MDDTEVIAITPPAVLLTVVGNVILFEMMSPTPIRVEAFEREALELVLDEFFLDQ